MPIWRHLAHGLRVLGRRAAADRDLDDELRHYADEATAAHVARGLDPASARRAALAEMGPATLVRERVRDHGWEQWVASWAQDLRLAGRTLRQTPLFTAIVVLVVALGTGAVSTVFSAMNAILLRPVPGVGDPAGVVTLQLARRDGSIVEQIGYGSVQRLRDDARSVAGVGAWGRATLTISTGGAGTTVLGNLVTADYFELLGVQPALGRFFIGDENRTLGTHPVVIVSHAFWQAQLGGDRQAVGRALTVNGRPFTLIGVAPPAFRGLYTGLAVDAWAPLMMQPQLRPRTSLTGGSWLWAFARLRPDVPAPTAQAELSALMAAPPTSGPPRGPDAIASMRAVPLTGLPGGSHQAFALLGILLGAGALVLVIAGVNVAALLAGRYTSRARDLAVRAALGAGRLRLLRQLLTEVLLLFALGAIGGVVVATVATGALERLPMPAGIPITLEISPDHRVLAFALAAALTAGLFFGLGPALQGASRDITDRLKAESAGTGRRRSRLGRALVAGQLALSLVLLVAAGLFVRAIERGAGIDPGFDRHGVATVALEPESWGYAPAVAATFYTTLRERLAASPGITAVASATRLPLMLSSSMDTVGIGSGTRDIAYVAIEGDYFDVLRLPILRGRAFADGDGAGAPAVAMVNEALARLIAPDGDAIGRTLRFRDRDTIVVGIARDARQFSLDQAAAPFLYVPLAQAPDTKRVLMVRSARTDIATAIVAAVQAIDPRLPTPRVSTLDDDSGIVLFPQRAAAIVIGGLGATGVLLAALGLYGTVSGSVARRTREIGVRLALGADRGAVLRTVVGEGARLALAGIAAGLALAALAMPLLRAWLFGVDPRDPATYAVLAAGLVGVALAASYLPARRAAATDPLRALRTD